jgi:hypothetical protein
MENDHHLPESSLTAPIFPDFNDMMSSEGPVLLQPQLAIASSSSAAAAVYHPDVMDTLPNLADPKVTVQSLFMEDDE